MPRARRLVGNTDIRSADYKGQFGTPQHMLTLSDIRALQDDDHLEGGGLGSMMKSVAKNKMVKGLAKTALKQATPYVSDAIANRTGIDPNLTKAITKAAVGQINDQVIGSGFGKFLKQVGKNKIVKDVAKIAVKQAVPMVSGAIASRTGLNPGLTSAITNAAANAVIGGGGVGVYTKKTRKPAAPNDKRRRRGALISQLMKEGGMTLAEASRYIKENNIEY